MGVAGAAYRIVIGTIRSPEGREILQGKEESESCQWLARSGDYRRWKREASPKLFQALPVQGTRDLCLRAQGLRGFVIRLMI